MDWSRHTNPTVVAGYPLALLHGIKHFPVGELRYRLVTIDRSQRPQTEDRGCFSRFESAASEGRALIPSHADKAIIYDTVRGHAVAKIE